MENKIKILLIEDSVDDAQLIKRKLEKSALAKFQVTVSQKLDDGLKQAVKIQPDLILSDLGLPDSHGLDTVTKILIAMPHIPLVVLSGFDDEATAIKAVQSGAQDYLVKAYLDNPKWEQAILYSLERAHLREELEKNTSEIDKLHNNLMKILQNNADAIMVVDESRRILFVNNAVESLFGRKPRELLKLPFQYSLDVGKAFEIVIHRADEKTTIAETTVVNIAWEGKPAYLVSMHNITHRKAMEEALQTSEEKYRTIFEMAKDGIVTFDLQGKITSCNEAFARINGSAINEIIGKHFTEILSVTQKDAASYANMFSTLLNDGTLPPLEFTWPHIDGTTKIVEVRASLMKQNGKTIGMQAMTVDITERKALEKALADEATRRRILIEQSSDGIVILDQDGKVYEANQRFADMLGYSIDEINNLYVFDWEFQTSRERLTEMIKTVNEKGDHFETQHRRKDGTIIDVEISTNGAMFAGQKLIFCVCRDITKRKAMEKAMIDSEEKFSKAFMNSPQAIVLTDLEKGTILEANDTFLQLTGYARKDLIGKKAIDLSLWNSPNEREKIIHDLKEKGVVKNFERQFRTKAGDMHTWLFSAETVTIDNKPCMLSVTVDITERKKTEELLRYSDTALKSIYEGIYATDNDFIVTRWNEMCERIFGIKAYDAIGKSVKEILDLVEEYHGQNEKRAKLLLEKGFNQEEQVYHTPHGDVWVDAHSQVMEDNGQPTGWVTLISDITDRKRTEEKLRESEERYRDLFENATDLIQSCDIGGKFSYVNKAWRNAMGYSETEVPNLTFKDIVHPDFVESCQHTFDSVIAGNTLTGVETYFISKDNKIIQVEGNVNPVIKDGKVIATRAIFRDITSRKKAEQALIQSEEKYRELINTSNDAIISVDPQMKVTIWNQGAEKIFWYTENDMLGQSILKIVPDMIHNKMAIGFDQVIRNGTGAILDRVMEQVGTRKDGVKIPIELTVSIRKVDHSFTATAIIRDITVRKEAEKALIQSEEKYRELINTSTDAIISVDSQMKIAIWNRGAERIYGYSESEILGQSIMTVFPTTLHKDVAREIVNSKNYNISKIESRIFETTGLKKDCSTVPIEVSISTRKAENDLIITMIIRDITIRREAEEKLKQIEQMKSEFLSNVSHELRTPLQSISGFTKLILTGKVPDPAVQQEFLNIIDRETMHLGNLINGLLDMSRLEAGRFEIYKKPTVISDIFTDSFKMFHSLAREKNINLTEVVPAKLPEMDVDSERIHQVVINLLSNALKFSDPGSSVNVKVTLRDKELLFQVIDHGIGIAEESKMHLFERFYRSEDEKVRGGTGLGLYISKQIIEAHGGRIWAESKFGEGSTFSFTLPLQELGGKQDVKKDTGNRRRPGHSKARRVLSKARGIPDHHRV